MSIIDKLATATGNRNEEPNIVLAKEIAAGNDAVAVKELVSLFAHKNKQIQSDSIKTLYELAALKPELIAPYHKDLSILLNSKNNRLAWGAMTALDAITEVVPKEIYNMLKQILEVADKGSVITKDHAVFILAKLARINTYNTECSGRLLHMLANSADNQFPKYSETIAPVVSVQDNTAFIEIVQNRIPLLEKDSAKKRVEKLLKKLQK